MTEIDMEIKTRVYKDLLEADKVFKKRIEREEESAEADRGQKGEKRGDR